MNESCVRKPLVTDNALVVAEDVALAVMDRGIVAHRKTLTLAMKSGAVVNIVDGADELFALLRRSKRVRSGR